MKTPPDNPEFAVFTDAMRQIMKVRKVDVRDELRTERRKPKTSASLSSGAASKLRGTVR